MKLIDLLVQELPKHGGWPVSIDEISMHEDGDIFFDGKYAPKSFVLPKCSDGWGPGNRLDNTTTRKEYESALLASEQPAWNGKRVPPVGCECEAKYLHAANAEWFAFRCVAVDCEVAFGWGGKEPANLKLKDFEFRPIQTQAERERNARITTLNNFISGFMKSTNGDYTHLGEAIYEWQNVLDKLKK